MRSSLQYHHDELYMEGISLKKIADAFGTPSYIYSTQQLIENWQRFQQAFVQQEHLICYAVKANSHLAVLNILAQLGAGFDIVSGGELKRALKAGAKADKIIFSGVGKSQLEIEQAIDANIYCINVESEPELQRINQIAAQKNKRINIALRVNPHVDPHTHAFISTGLRENKFGIDSQDIIPLCRRLSTFNHVNLIGIACHIGSQITKLMPFAQALDRLLDLYHQLKSYSISLKHINVVV
jgi:diaminopimelate decarboxylase